MRKSIRFLVGVSLSFFLTAFIIPPSLLAQNLGDYYTAGYSNARTGANAQMGDFRPPLKLVRSIPLSGIDHPTLLMAFEDSLLVGRSGGSVSYHLLDGQTGEQRWEQTLPGGPASLFYVPAYAHDIVFLGGSTSTGAKAVRVSTGEMLWSDEAIGNTQGRHPLISGDVVVYSSADRVVAARIETGEVLWQIDTPTAMAPLCSSGDLVFWLDSEYAVHAVRLRTGEEEWHSELPPGTPPGVPRFSDLVAVERRLFVSVMRDGLEGGLPSFVRAFDAASGDVVWSRSGRVSTPGGLLVTGDRLYEFGGDFRQQQIYTYDPDSGELLWQVEEPGNGGPPNSWMPMGQIANGVAYYLGHDQDTVARDALTGAVLWNVATRYWWVWDLCLADGRLLALLDDRIDIYEPSHEIFFAHLANGGGQTTLLTLTNATFSPATVNVHFLDDDGEPLSLAVEGREGLSSTIPFTIPGRSSVAIRTAGGSELQSGWARVESDRTIKGSSIFQYSGNGLDSEAGVADASAVGEASLFVEHDDGVSTAVAIAVPVDADAAVMLRLLDEDGLELASNEVTIPGGGHTAQFIDELFPDEVGDRFQGTLALYSVVPVVVTALRTKNGIQLSSYPVAPTGY